MSTLNITENIFTSLEIECEKAGTNLTEVCKLAKVDRSAVQRWKDSEPKTIQSIRKMKEVIERKREENQK